MCEIVKKKSEFHIVIDDVLANNHKRCKCSLHIAFMHPETMLNQLIEVYGSIM